MTDDNAAINTALYNCFELLAFTADEISRIINIRDCVENVADIDRLCDSKLEGQKSFDNTISLFKQRRFQFNEIHENPIHNGVNNPIVKAEPRGNNNNNFVLHNTATTAATANQKSSTSLARNVPIQLQSSKATVSTQHTVAAAQITPSDPKTGARALLAKLLLELPTAANIQRPASSNSLRLHSIFTQSASKQSRDAVKTALSAPKSSSPGQPHQLISFIQDLKLHSCQTDTEIRHYCYFIALLLKSGQDLGEQNVIRPLFERLIHPATTIQTAISIDTNLYVLYQLNNNIWTPNEQDFPLFIDLLKEINNIGLVQKKQKFEEFCKKRRSEAKIAEELHSEESESDVEFEKKIFENTESKKVEMISDSAENIKGIEDIDEIWLNERHRTLYKLCYLLQFFCHVFQADSAQSNTPAIVTLLSTAQQFQSPANEIGRSSEELAQKKNKRIKLSEDCAALPAQQMQTPGNEQGSAAKHDAQAMEEFLVQWTENLSAIQSNLGSKYYFSVELQQTVSNIIDLLLSLLNYARSKYLAAAVEEKNGKTSRENQSPPSSPNSKNKPSVGAAPQHVKASASNSAPFSDQQNQSSSSTQQKKSQNSDGSSLSSPNKHSNKYSKLYEKSSSLLRFGFSVVKQSSPGKHSLIHPSVDRALLSFAARGLSFYANFITAEEEERLIAEIDKREWGTYWQRRTQIYGFHDGEDVEEGGETSSRVGGSAYDRYVQEKHNEAIPEFCGFLLQRLYDYGVFTTLEPAMHVIINEYREDQGIGAHTDYLTCGRIIAGLTLGNPCWMRLHELAYTHDPQFSSANPDRNPHLQPVKPFFSRINNKTPNRIGHPVDVFFQSRSLYVLQDDMRYSFQHEIRKSYLDRPKTGFRRISLTFRSSPKV
jgi:alkylated DNA repair dioxygenase AlkB